MTKYSNLRQNKYFRFGFFIALDIIAIVFSVWLSFLIRFEGAIPSYFFPFMIRIIILGIVFIVPVFYFSKLYSFSWAYVSTNELVALFKATTISFLFLGITIYISKYFPYFTNFPRSTLFISYFLVFIFCGALRFAKRVYLHQFKKEDKQVKRSTLIVGAGDAGEQILRNILSSKTIYRPVGFVDDNSIKQGILIHGLKVLGKIDDMPAIIKKHDITELIIALPSAGADPIKKSVNFGRTAGLKNIRIIPSISEIIDGNISIKDLKEIGVEDLLGREKISLDTIAIEKFIEGKKVLITGAAGSIGSELAKQVSRLNPELLVLLDWDETGIFNIAEELKNKFPELKFKFLIANIRDSQKINEIFKETKPNIVFHAAAYKHVPLMEIQPEEAVKNNVFGTDVVAKAALSYEVDKFIFISTDKAVNPTSVMGATKRIGEMICQVLNQENRTKLISVRFGNVLNSRGSVIPTFKEQIKRGGPVEVTHPEMKRYFMLTSEACLLVMQAGAMGEGGEVFVLDMGKPIKILNLAKEVIRSAGFEPDKEIPIIITKPRPGEKLFEDILMAEEGTVATKSQKIFTAKLADVDSSKLKEQLGELGGFTSSSENNREKIINCLKKILPFYKPAGF